jgi:hypothetical protein
MARNNLPVWYRENFSVLPDFNEGWTEKFHPVAAKPFMLRQAQHERLAGRICDFVKLFLTES